MIFIESSSDDSDMEDQQPWNEGDIVKVKCSFYFTHDELEFFLNGIARKSRNGTKYVLCVVTEVDYSDDSWWAHVVPYGLMGTDIPRDWFNEDEGCTKYEGKLTDCQSVYFSLEADGNYTRLLITN